MLGEVAIAHSAELSHHVNQGRAWLSLSEGGDHSTALSYAAFELRFGVERIAVHYWSALLDRKVEPRDLTEMESFKLLERRIYELAGHQKRIDLHFDFMRVVLQALKIDAPMVTPKIGLLAKHWSQCSEYCHVAWPLSSSENGVRKAAYKELTAVAESLAMQVQSLGWPVIQDAAFETLRDEFVTGAVDASAVGAYLEKVGLWAKVEYPDGRASHFIGEPVAPIGNSGAPSA